MVRFHPGPLLDSSFCYVLFSFVCFVFGFFCFGIFRLFCLVCCICLLFCYDVFVLFLGFNCFNCCVLIDLFWVVLFSLFGCVEVGWSVCFVVVVLFVSFVLPWLLCLGLVPFVLVVLPGLSPPP